MVIMHHSTVSVLCLSKKAETLRHFRCLCCDCKNICESGKNFFGRFGSGAEAVEHFANSRKTTRSSSQSEHATSAFQNFLPFVPPSGESQALTEVPRPVDVMGNDITPDFDDLKGITGFDSETISVSDTENQRQVSINKTLPAPINNTAVEQFLRENNFRRPDHNQLTNGQGTNGNKFSHNGNNRNLGHWNDNSRNQVPRSQRMATEDAILNTRSSLHQIMNGSDTNFNEISKTGVANKGAPEVRAESCGTICDGSPDYDPYVFGTFSGMRAEAPWPPAQEPMNNVDEKESQQGAKEYYDEVEVEEGNGRTTFPPSPKHAKHTDLDFLDGNPGNTCRLCGSTNIDDTAAAAGLQNQPTMGSFFAGSYDSETKHPKIADTKEQKMLAANTTLRLDDATENHISLDSSISNISTVGKNPKFLDSSNLINLPEALHSLQAQALPLVGDFRPQNLGFSPKNSMKSASKDREAPDVSPPSLLVMEQRLSNDTSSSFVQSTKLAGVKTQLNKLSKKSKNASIAKKNILQDNTTLLRDSLVQPKVKYKILRDFPGEAFRGVLKNSNTTPSGQQRKLVPPNRHTATADPHHFFSTRRKPKHMKAAIKHSLGDKTQVKIRADGTTSDSSPKFDLMDQESPSRHDRSEVQQDLSTDGSVVAPKQPKKSLDELTTPVPTEETLLYPPIVGSQSLGEETLMRPSIRTRKAKFFDGNAFKRSKTPILELL